MKTLLTTVFLAVCLSLGTAAYSAAELTPNLVRDGGFEQWDEVGPESWKMRFFVKNNWQMSFTDKGNVLIPLIFSQYTGKGYILKMENTDVFSGKHSLRLKGSTFLGKTSEDAYNTRSGDIYVVRYMAKGTGDTMMHFTVYGQGGRSELERKGTPVADKWTLIEQRFLIGGSAPTTIYPRLTASEEMLIDDVFVGRVLREDEQAESKKVPEEYDERIAFAPAVSPAPAIDGKLDEECWKSAVPFAGFRLYAEQICFAPSQIYFRILHDEKALYFGMEIMLPDAQGVFEKLKVDPIKDSDGKPMAKTGDVWSGRHSVEIFIQPPGQGRYIQYVVSLDGYRYDGVGKDGSFNGNWTYGMSTGKDRWFLEMMIPASDLKLEKITSTEGRRLTVARNTESFYSTWSAVGHDFHNPLNFGTLITKDFSEWRTEKLQEWGAMRKKAADKAEELGLTFGNRLERTERFTQTLPATTGGEKLDWERITRVYMLMNFVDGVYRVMNAEMMYAGFWE